MAFEVFILPTNEGDPGIGVYSLRGILSEYGDGTKTDAQCFAAIEGKLGVSLDEDQEADIQNEMDLIDAQGGIPWAKQAQIESRYSKMLLAQDGIWYNTQPLLRAALGWSEPE